MSRLTDRLEHDLGEIAAGADPSPSAWASIVARLGEDAEAELAYVRPRSTDRSQRRAWIVAIAATFLVVAGAIAVLANAGDDDSTGPADTGPTTTFESPRHGYSVDVPEGSTITPATQLWGGGDNGFDIIETGAGAVFKGASTDFGSEFEDWELREPSIDAQIDQRVDESEVFPGGCLVPRSNQADITIDGQPGRIAECEGHIEATVVLMGSHRLYLFTLLDAGRDARADFDALAASIRLTPETVVRYPSLTSTFVSPTYGYSFGFLDRGGLAPATERWDPVPGQFVDNDSIDGRFDGVETGQLAYLGAASTPIPEGVPIDDWVDSIDLKLTPESSLSNSGWERCYVPRREQEEITIDGRPGRILECPGNTQATVAAGGRLYLFILLRGETDVRAFFDSWVETIRLTPETAVGR